MVNKMPEETPADVRAQGTASPVQPGERIAFVDILRGFAIFGILVANMAGFSGYAPFIQDGQAVIDGVVLVLIRLFITAKFYSLFSFLFGWGLSVQMARARERGTRFTPLYLRRLLVLLLIGIVHGVLIWSGDILTLYALLGFLLFLVRNRSERTILTLVVLCLLLSIFLSAPWKVPTEIASRYENLTEFMRLEQAPANAYSLGSYRDITRLRVEEYLRGLSSFLFYFGNIFSMFLLGLWAGKRRIFQEVELRLPLLKKVMVGGLIIGMLGNLLYVWLLLFPGEMPVAWLPQSYHRMLQHAAYTLGAPALMLFYVTGLVLLLRKKTWRNLLCPLANVGRMALSNYLFQSILATWIFYSYGLGLYGEISPFIGLILTVVIFWIQIRISGWWFDRHRYGPAEWVWRFLTYGKGPHSLPATAIQPAGILPGKMSARINRVTLFIKRLHPAWMLSLTWMILLVWVGLLITWQQQIRSTRQTQPFVAEIAETAIPTNAVDQSDNAGQVEETRQDSNPEFTFQPMPYHPGEIAASGDMEVLVGTFDVEQALFEIKTLTGPPYLGRQAGSPQGWAAGEYLSSQFARYGLQPLGEGGTYFQEFPVLYTPLEDMPRLYLESAGNSTAEEFIAYQDFMPVVRWYAGSGVGKGQVYWMNRCAEEDFAARDVVGKVLLCLPDASPNWLAQLSRRALEHGAAALLFLTDEEVRPPDFGWAFKEVWVPEPVPVFYVYADMVARLLRGNDKTIPDLLANAPPFLLESTVGFEMQTLQTSSCPGSECIARNVIGILPGRDPAYANEAIILGAHYDHMGQAPNGMVWPGANDDASGVAVLLEIARSWHEQGYIPRRTVIFAAWDAEELGLLGSIHYVQNPPFPLENTIAMIQLDMVGAGSPILNIDGNHSFGAGIGHIAETVGVEARITDGGGSDHIPFLSAGVPASALLWEINPDEEITYHRPMDTVEAIDAGQLSSAARIAELAVLNLAESEPAIEEMLAARAQAAQDGDLETFLSSSHPDQAQNDLYWYQDLQSLQPTRVNLSAGNLLIAGNQASATVQIDVDTIDPSDNVTHTLTARLPVAFTFGPAGWQWSGPPLVWNQAEASLDERTIFQVGFSPGKEDGVSGAGQGAIAQYQRITSLLGFSPDVHARLIVLENTGVLWGSTALSQPGDRLASVNAGEIKLVYSEAISTSLGLQDSLVQLALAESGVNEALAPWLWQGLPLAIQGYDQSIATQVRFIPALQEGLAPGSLPTDLVSSWAATAYLQERLGWDGLGNFIIRLGELCQEDCDPQGALDAALLEFLALDAADFETVWQSAWQNRLENAQAALDALLSARSLALSSGNEQALLGTIDRSVPNLEVEELHWLEDYHANPPQQYQLTGRPLAFLEGGSLLAEMTLEYQPDEGDNTTTTFTILLTPSDQGYYWAGPLLERLQGEWVDILYPNSQADLAVILLAQAEQIAARLGATLDISLDERLIIKLYETPASYQASIAGSLPQTNVENAWTSPGESIKLNIIVGGGAEDYTGLLAYQLSRSLLYQSGLEAGWLVEGVSATLSRSYELASSSRPSGLQIAELFEAVNHGQTPALNDILPSLQLPGERLALDRGLARDAVDFMVTEYGWPALLEILDAQQRGISLNNAFRSSLGITVEQFEADWRSSLLQQHMNPEWVEVAQAFNPELAMESVNTLASPALEGRQAGSPGSAAAAQYIAEQFESYGLLPVGDGLTTTDGFVDLSQLMTMTSPVSGSQSSYFQTFPISYTIQTALPGLELLTEAGEASLSLIYRQDFLLVQGDACSGTVSAPLVWGGKQAYPAIDLAGKIVLRNVSSDFQGEIDSAISHGAAGLILVNNRWEPEELFAKQPAMPQDSLGASIPVFELSQPGYSRLLESLGYDRQSIARLDAFYDLDRIVRLECNPDRFETVQTQNVLGLLPGSDPILRQEVIILGAHYDFVGNDAGGSLYSGANDNASGVAVLLEIARVLHEQGYSPKRSILFAAWGAQEPGQVGSNYYLANPLFPLQATVAMIQLDGVGGGDGFNLGVQGAANTDGELLFTLSAVELIAQEKLVYTSPYNVSDDTPFRQAGIPSVLISWRLANEDNLPDDLANAVHPERLGTAGQVILLLLLALGRG